MRNERNIRLSILLLSVFTFFQVSTSMFPHRHIIDGRSVSHSHPWQNPNHSHTDRQIATISYLSTFSSLQPADCDFAPEVFFPTEEILIEAISEKPEDGFVRHIFLRGPPAADTTLYFI